MNFKQKPRIIYNDDSCGLRVIKPPHSLEQVSTVVDYMRDSQVDCVCWFMASDVAYSYNSDIIDSINELYERDPDFVPAGKPLGKNFPLSMHKQGIDYLPLLIDKFHDADISFYGSIRMNDAHHKSKPDGWLSSEFWKKHQDWRLWEVQDGFSYYNATLDYSHPEVRDQKTGVVREILERYDLDGIEIDFIRNPYTFQPSEAWEKRQILTDYIAEIKGIVDEYSKKKGRELGLILRVPFEDEWHKRTGMDIKQWLEDGLIDILAMSNKSNNYKQFVKPWLSMCRKYNVLFYPSIEAGPMLNWKPDITLPHGVLPPRDNAGMKPENDVEETVTFMRGMAQNYLEQEPDGIYMFNYPCKLFETKHSNEDFNSLTSILAEIGDTKTMTGKEKKYIFCQDLPIYIEASRPAKYHQTIKFNINEKLDDSFKVKLSFRRAAAQNPHSYVDSIGPALPDNYMQTIFNGRMLDEKIFVKTMENMEMIPSGFHNIGKHEKIEINLKGSELICGENTLAFEIPRFPKEEDPYVYIYELIVTTMRI
jgi:Glycosyl hydrolase-like 10